jgi:hypothetical protein
MRKAHGRQCAWCQAICLLIVMVCAFGCKSEGSCDELYEVLSECDEGFKQAEEAFLKECKSRRSENVYKAYIACSVNEDCGDYQTCVTDASNALKAAARAQRLKTGLAELKKNIETAAFRQADAVCKRLLAEFPKHPEITKQCNSLPATAAAALEVQLTKLRDSGKAEQFLSLCNDYKEFARKVGPDTRTKAVRLCREVDISRTVEKAVAQAKDKLEKKEARLPFDCRLAYKDLKSLESKWAHTARMRIVKHCYLKLGQAILSARVPAMKYVCDLEVKKVYQVLRRLDLKNDNLIALVARAKPLCSR